MALNSITYYPILGLPLIAYLGIITYVLFVGTALISILNAKGKTKINFKWHPRLAKLALAFATVHGFLGLAAYI